jgi:hypothetical protein
MHFCCESKIWWQDPVALLLVATVEAGGHDNTHNGELQELRQQDLVAQWRALDLNNTHIFT